MRGVEWSPGAETSRLVWPDGRPVDGLLQHHWRLGEDEAGRPLYAGLFDHGAGWRRRWTARTHGAACAWALLRKAEGGAEAGFEILQPDLLSANPRGPDDAAPGGGSVVRTRLANGAGAEGTAYALFYTGRRLEVPRVVLDDAPEHAEAVQLAVLRRERLAPGVQDAVWRVRRTEFRLAPDPAWHVTEAGEGRPMFRDPFVFQDRAGGTFMVVASRARSGPPGRDAALTVYAIEGALDDAAAYRRVGAYAPGRYAVLEAPHVAWVGEAPWLTFNAATERDGPRSVAAVPLPLDAQGSLRPEGWAGELELLPATEGLRGAFVDEGLIRGHVPGGGPRTVGAPPWAAEERLQLEHSTHLAAPLGRAAELTDATHQWELRKAALFTRELTDVQRAALRGGAALAGVLTSAQRRLLDDFYAGRL